MRKHGSTEPVANIFNLEGNRDETHPTLNRAEQDEEELPEAYMPKWHAHPMPAPQYQRNVQRAQHLIHTDARYKDRQTCTIATSSS